MCGHCHGWGRDGIFGPLTTYLDPMASYAFDAAHWAELGYLPGDGGYLSQSAWAMHAIAAVREARDDADAELRKRREKK